MVETNGNVYLSMEHCRKSFQLRVRDDGAKAMNMPQTIVRMAETFPLQMTYYV